MLDFAQTDSLTHRERENHLRERVVFVADADHQLTQVALHYLSGFLTSISILIGTTRLKLNPNFLNLPKTNAVPVTRH